MSLIELRKQLDNKEISAPELTRQYLSRIAKVDPKLNSYITVCTEQAEKAAVHAQEEIDRGNQGPLTGIPYAVKDIFCTKDIRTTAGSHILKEYIPPYSATAVEKCQDAVLLGKTNMDEFAMGSSTEYSAFGPTKNPFDLTRVPGGTSGGSTAAVAADLAVFALGTDTGGSIRQPASFCNVVGLKLTYGRISRYGVIASASSLDTVGMITQNVADGAYVLKQLAGHDPLDATTSPVPIDDYLNSLEKTVSGLRVGIPKEYLELAGLDPRIKERFLAVQKVLAKLGVGVEEISLPHSRYGLATYYILNPSENSSNLARYDGIQYGRPAKGANSLDEVYTKTREEGFGAESKRRIMIGTFCLSAGYYDAYYKQAQKVRTLVSEDFTKAFEQVDVIMSPTSPTLPFKLGERESDPLSMYTSDIYTIPASLAGLPAFSLPAGAVDNLPVAVQLIAPQFAEKRILQLGYHLEQSFDF